MKKKLSHKKAAPDSADNSLNGQTASSIKKLMMLICAAFAFALYANTLNHKYTIDDHTVIKNNKITTKGISALPEVFTTAYRAGFWERKENMYRPLSVAMFAIEYSIAPEKPFVGHLMNVLLYTLTAVVLFLLLSALFVNTNPIIAFIATLLFIAHPLHTEVIANIKSRDEILCFLFAIASLLAMVNYVKQKQSLLLVLSGLFIFLSLLSKENAITYLAIAPLTLYFFTNANKKQMITCTGMFAGTIALYYVLRIAVLGGATNFVEIQLGNNSLVGAEGDFGKRLASSIFIMGKYILLLFFPHPLSFDYSYNTIPLVTFGDFRALISLAIVGALGFYAIKGFKTKNPVAYGIFYFALTISLVSNIVFLIEATLGERFTYMPSVGFCIAIAMLLAKYYKVNLQKLNYESLQDLLNDNKKLLTITSVVLLLFSFKTFSRNMVWKDNFTLLTTDVKTNPESARIRCWLGGEYVLALALKKDSLDDVQKSIDLDSGIVHLEKGLAILPTFSEDAWFHLGAAYKEKKDYKNSIRCFEQARIMKEFKEFDFYIASGIAYGEDKQLEKAFADINKAIAIRPGSDEAYNLLGKYQTEAGMLDKAIVSLNKSISLKPSNKIAIYNLGNTYVSGGDFKKAIECYEKVILIDPTYGVALNNMGNSYVAIKDYKNALVYYQKLLALQPNNANVIYNIGVTYMMLGDSVNGNSYLARAKKMNGGR